MAPRGQVKTNVQTVFAIIEMVLFSGVIYGWANMVLILKDEDYFKDLCAQGYSNTTMSMTALEKTTNADDSEKCGPQDERLALIFTLSVFSFNVAGFIGGSLLDKYGTRFVRLLACFFYLLAGIFAFLLDKETANLMFPLMICLACAGMFLAISLFQISVLHPKHQFVISSSLSGALDSSSVVFLVFKVVYDTGVGLRWILVAYLIVAIVCVLAVTFLLLPKTSIAAAQEESPEAKAAVDRGVTNVVATSEPVEYQRGKSNIELGVCNDGVTPDTVEYQGEKSTVEEVSPDAVVPNMVMKTVDGNTNAKNGTNRQAAAENGKPRESVLPLDEPTSPEHDKYSSGPREINRPCFYKTRGRR